MKLLKDLAHRFGRSYIRRTLANEAETQSFRRLNERPVEFAFLFRQVARLCPRTVLDVGTGTTALPALLRTCGCMVTASDNVYDYWPAGMFNRHWRVILDDITRSNLPGQYDMITCISVLEHIPDHRAAMREMFRLLVPGGHLVLTCPYTEHEYIEDVFQLPNVRDEFRDQPYKCRSYSRVEVDVWLADCGAEVVEQQYWRIDTGKCHGQGDWLFPPIETSREQLHQHTCLLMRKK